MDKQAEQDMKQRKALLEGLPKFNIGALLVPPIWGPAHGLMVTIVFYPLWLFTDNLIYAAVTQPSALSVTLAAIVLAVMAAGTFFFARVAQGFAAERAIIMRGKTKEQYVREQKYWAIGMAVLALVVVGAATYFNICIRPTLGA